MQFLIKFGHGVLRDSIHSFQGTDQSRPKLAACLIKNAFLIERDTFITGATLPEQGTGTQLLF